ncbi:MAG: M14 family zinc carboxypeptidase, partial [Chitinophagaceae bacterium]
MQKHKKTLLVLLTFFTLNHCFQKSYAQSPESFLGYKIGDKFTRHHKIVEYFKTIAAANPEQIKIENYGETNEGRELMIAIISSKENMVNLDQIKVNNRTYAGLTKGRLAPLLPNPPAIVWLSYNVHGNEPSSSEAAMLALYELINPTKSETKEYLKNTVVIIDPCLNPDGRDRYVNWYNTTVGKNGNIDPQSREHFEAYP